MQEVTSMKQLEKVDQPFGPRLKVAREMAGLSQAELAERLGVDRASIAAWETDQRAPRANRVLTLAGLLGVSIGWLLEGREDEHMANGQQTPSIDVLLAQIESLRLTLSEATEQLRNIDDGLHALARSEAASTADPRI